MWALERVEDRDKFEFQLYEPLPGDDPDRVDQRTIDEENASFARFASEARG